MNYSISGYNLYEENEFCIENVIMNEEKMNNLKKLDQIAVLEDGWNGNKAKAFEKQFILTVRSIITALEIQPEIFPTACDSVQFEYEKEDGSYLEIEINSDDRLLPETRFSIFLLCSSLQYLIIFYYIIIYDYTK